ncbi:MAG: hypothetical protein WCI92_05430 [Bacteroidota bacterium]
MSFLKDCDRCGNEFEAQRDSAKYCSDSCKTLACRSRRAEEQELAERQAVIHAANEKNRRRLEEMQANFEKSKAEAQARQELFNQEKKERESKEQHERELKYEKVKADRAKLHAKRMHEVERTGNMIALGGLGAFGMLNYFSGLLNKQPERPEE